MWVEFIQDFNRRFSVVPRSLHDAHHPLRPTDDLDRILTKQETRTLSKNLTFQYKKVIYQILSSRPSYALRKAQVTVCEDAQGEISVLYKGHHLSFSVFHKQQRQAEGDASQERAHPPGVNHSCAAYAGPPNTNAPTIRAGC